MARCVNVKRVDCSIVILLAVWWLICTLDELLGISEIALQH